jgi:MFS family permease
MPAIAFAANFLWVMVMGLLGPCLPQIVTDLGITYPQAGLLFTLLSLGSLFGTTLGAAASDSVSRRLLLGGCALCLGAGLALLGLMPVYGAAAAMVFLLSLLGSPIGASSQSVMLEMFPGRREQYLSLMTMFAAVGSLVAPLLVALNTTLSLSWRWVFIQTAFLPVALFAAVMAVRLPRPAAAGARGGLGVVARNPTVIGCAVAIFFSVAMDLGFSYWLAEYFKRVLAVSLGLSSAVVGIYLLGIIAARALIPAALKRFAPRTLIIGGISVSLCGLALFLILPSPAAKAGLCALYGLGVGPVFPLLMARGSREFPGRSGAVSGLLFGSLSLGGMAFPFLIGALASRVGLWRSFFLPAAIGIGLLAAMIAWRQRPADPERTHP